MFTVGQTVRVIGVFAESFPLEYIITEEVISADGTTAFILGEHGGFATDYLEAV